MKHIFLNLKRFDIPKEYGGVNAIAAMKDWGSYIVEQTQKGLMEYGTEDVEFAMFFPEAHILTAAGTLCEGSPVKVGCQGVFRQDTAVGGGTSEPLLPAAQLMQPELWDAVMCSSATVRNERIRQGSLQREEETRQL